MQTEVEEGVAGVGAVGKILMKCILAGFKQALIFGMKVQGADDVLFQRTQGKEALIPLVPAGEDKPPDLFPVVSKHQLVGLTSS